ncbi:hypothetical protein OH76DRAFT_1438336 [Lentinus brumalis]|uniref:FYR N-terminal domain-containing protein n=1 Tax=Lentinus brumalis TaxID=2498619 RepID=A0A371DBN6_9APHY|nr:hypothetical protein OH76DRAFT_1438336 [Polyporus brumalis]
MSHTPRTPMGPPQDVVMGPPPLPPQAGQPATQKPPKEPDITAKYSRLKRKYFELEEKHKEAMLQLRSSGERNVKWRAEKALLLDRITELELNPVNNPGAPIPPVPFTAFPRCLLNDRNQQKFVSNLRQAIDELEREDPDIDPHLLSRHIGPAARKRQEAELRERQEEEAREAAKRPTTRKPRGTPAKGKDIGAPLTYAPAPVHGAPPPGPGGPGALPSPPVLVSSGGTRLRLKPPAPPGSEGAPGHAHHRSESLSPVLSPQEEYMHAEGMSPSYQHGGPPAQSQMQMTLRTSSASSRPSEIQRHTKPKRLKAHTVTTKSFSIPTVPRDRKGKPILPLNVGIMTVINLGEVCMREHFHTERYIFPVGYEVTRRYSSTVNPDTEVVYYCKILDGGDGPKFQITAADIPDKPIVAGTATGAWSVVVRAANHIRNRAHSNSVSGPDFFGLGQNTIKHLIQELPHANQLKNYVWQHFVEGGSTSLIFSISFSHRPLGGRHAAVIPALPDEHEPSSPGANENGYYEGETGAIPTPAPTPTPAPASAPISAPLPAPTPGPAQAPLGRHGELQIIHVEKEDPSLRPRNAPTPQVSVPMNTIITFHQEFPNAPPEPSHRGRRSSRAIHAGVGFEEYTPPSAMRVDSPVHARTASRSPVLHRERSERADREHDHFSPPHALPPHAVPHPRAHGALPSPHHRSPYDSHSVVPNGAESVAYRAGTPPPPVPATFASIMNAYPAPPMTSPPANEGAGPDYTYANGSSRRNGHPPPGDR